MKRRSFLQGVLGVGAASVTGAALPKILPSPIVNTVQDSSIVTQATHFKPLWPGLEKWYLNSYGLSATTNDPRTKALAESMQQTKEQICIDVYNKAFKATTL